MTDYETLAWPWTMASGAAADYGDRAQSEIEGLGKRNKTHWSVRDGDGSALLWQYVSDTHGYVTSDDADDEADGVAFERRQTARLLFVDQDSDTDEEEEEDTDGGEEDADEEDEMQQDGGASSGWTDGDVEGKNGGDWDDQDAYFVIDHDNGTVVPLARGAGSGRGATRGTESDAGGEPEEGDAQRAYADALVAALGDVDEVHMHGDGSVALRKDRHLPVVLMGGVGAPAKIADASITAAQAPDGVTAFLGEVALLGDEVGAAERALLADGAGAVVTALHNHWVSDPTLYYLHFQALTRDPAAFLNAVAPWWRSL